MKPHEVIDTLEVMMYRLELTDMEQHAVDQAIKVFRLYSMITTAVVEQVSSPESEGGTDE